MIDLVLVNPLPGVQRATLLNTLREISAELTNVRGTSHTPADIFNAYIRWANNSVRRLRTMVSAHTLERLVLTRRYWLLQSMADQAAMRPVTDLLESELADREAAISETVDELSRRIERWSRPGAFAVPDTSVYIKHPEKLEEWDLRAILELREEPIHILVPILVVDELDGLKESKDSKIRWRAGYSLAVLDRLIGDGTTVARLRAEDFSRLTSGEIPRGEVTVELLLDPPGHVRLPINDDEIVDRAVAAQGLADRSLTLVTYDTGQSMRARAAGVRAKKLRIEPETEPT